MTDIRIALIQATWELGNIDANVSKAEQRIREAAHNGANLVCLPEEFNTGYYCFDYPGLRDCAETEDGKSLTTMCSLAKELRIHILAPITTIVGTGLVEDMAYLIDDEGKVIGKYSKSHLVGQEQLYFRKGNQLPVFNTKLGRIGIVICYDICFPETTRILTIKGADLILCPSAWRDGSYFKDWLNQVTEARALDNTVFVAMINYVGELPNSPFCGCSQVVSPIGKVLTRASADKEEIVYQDIDMSLVSKERKDNTVLIDRRPELYGLISKM